MICIEASPIVRAALIEPGLQHNSVGEKCILTSLKQGITHKTLFPCPRIISHLCRVRKVIYDCDFIFCNSTGRVSPGLSDNIPTYSPASRVTRLSIWDSIQHVLTSSTALQPTVFSAQACVRADFPCRAVI